MFLKLYNRFNNALIMNLVRVGILRFWFFGFLFFYCVSLFNLYLLIFIGPTTLIDLLFMSFIAITAIQIPFLILNQTLSSIKPKLYLKDMLKQSVVKRMSLSKIMKNISTIQEHNINILLVPMLFIKNRKGTDDRVIIIFSNSDDFIRFMLMADFGGL